MEGYQGKKENRLVAFWPEENECPKKGKVPLDAREQETLRREGTRKL